jgi:hypothetical protein
MQKKIELNDLDIPKDDIDAWECYPKHRWVYELSRLLDAQNIKWSPFENENLPDKELNIELISSKTLIRQPGYIYTKKRETTQIITEVFINKGEIKLIRHIDKKSNKEISSLIGEVELRINAFVTLYFQKFTGIITTETYGSDIFRIRLRPFVDLNKETNQEVIKLVKKIYKKQNLIVTGLAEQVRATHETLTS